MHKHSKIDKHMLPVKTNVEYPLKSGIASYYLSNHQSYLSNRQLNYRIANRNVKSLVINCRIANLYLSNHYL